MIITLQNCPQLRDACCLPSGIANRTIGFDGRRNGTSHLKQPFLSSCTISPRFRFRMLESPRAAVSRRVHGLRLSRKSSPSSSCVSFSFSEIQLSIQNAGVKHANKIALKNSGFVIIVKEILFRPTKHKYCCDSRGKARETLLLLFQFLTINPLKLPILNPTKLVSQTSANPFNNSKGS